MLLAFLIWESAGAVAFTYELNYDTASRVTSVVVDAVNSAVYDYRKNGQLLTVSILGNGVSPTQDTDSDGIPDIEDPDDDNDGLTDTEEEALGTDPLNQTPTATVTQTATK